MLETIYKTRIKRGYINKYFPIVDTTNKSVNYFNINYVPDVLTAGKNVIKLGADGLYLKRDYEIDLEVLDVNGEAIYCEYSNFRDRYGYHYFVIYVYDNAAPGIGSITFAGVAEKDLNGNTISYSGLEHETEYNVKWSKRIDIRPTDRNITDILFKKAPEVVVSQVLTPYKFNFGTYALNDRLESQSLSDLVIYTSDNAGYDFTQNTSENIEDGLSVENTYNYFLQASTANTVRTNVRRYDEDVLNGYIYSEYNRYNTVLYDSQSRLTKDMEGSILGFANQDAGVSILYSWSYDPPLSSSTIQPYPSGSVADQIAAYKAKIVTVLNSKYALLEKAPTIKVLDTQDPLQPVERDYTIKRIQYATGSFRYPTSSLQEVQSINLSSSYIQFTFFDFEPLAGDVYRIKTYAKEAGRNAEYFQLNDHIVRPPEFLIDTDKQNQAVYAKNKSDFFVYGEFTTSSIAEDYWRGFSLESGSIYQYSFSTSGSNNPVSSSMLANGLKITSTAAVQRGAATRYYQTYVPNQPYSLSFYCILDAGAELEVYMSSTPLKDNVIGLQAPRAFAQTRDLSNNTAYNRFGKFIGKISNIDGVGTRLYDNVVFDFFPDGDGYGRPVLFLKTDSTTPKNAYISSVSVTPLDLVGYTPSILQFAAATPDSINILQDDDASLTQSLDLKIEYFTADGKQSEYTTYIPNVQINMINEIPGFCASEAHSFNEIAPFYYEVVSSSVQTYWNKMNTGTASLDPTQFTDCYFWPTFSSNNYGGYNWNLNSFQITGTTYESSTLKFTSGSRITSSWFRYDPILPIYAIEPPIGSIGPFPTMYSASVDGVYTDAVIDAYFNEETTPVDTARPFYQGDGASISKYDIASLQSTLLQYSNSLDILSNSTRKANLQKYLRSTRLHYPSTGSTYLYGFHENGGIYNVRFKLSKVVPLVYATPSKTPIDYPDIGNIITANTQVSVFNRTVDNRRYVPDNGSKLMVYIADIATPLSNLELVPGRQGFYPPSNNIVTIGNGYGVTPTIRFYDSGSGYNVDIYDIVLVQYGDKGQLVFDASGLDISLDSNGYYKIQSNNVFWGGVISDIEWCKIGTTTDPAFVKPSNFDDQFSTFIPFTPPPPTPPPVKVGGTTVANPPPPAPET